MPSYQVGASCYGSALAANQASASSMAGTVVLVGGQSAVVSISAVADNSITLDYTPLGGGALTSQTVAIIPQPCNLLTGADAAEISWMIGSAWIAVYVIKYLANYFQSETDGIKNDA